MILFIIQAIASAIILSVIFHSILIFKIKIDIHNLPIILLFLMAIVLANVLAVKSATAFLLIGALSAAVIFILSLLAINEKDAKRRKSAILLSIISIFIWPQIIILSLFYNTYRIYDLDGSS